MLVWAGRAVDDLQILRAGLSAPQAARIGRLIAEGADCLLDHPERGRDGKTPGTRELPLPGLPWRLVYREGAGGPVILRVLA